MKKILLRGRLHIVLSASKKQSLLSSDTRETAFVNAITAAGIAYTIAKACSMGELVECSCDKNLVHHNVLLNNNQMQPFDNTKNNNLNENRRNNHNRPRKPRRNGNKNLRNARKKAQRKAPTPLPSEVPGLPIVGENWEWSGCDDNVNFGNRKSKDFLDARFRRRSDIKTLVKIHNNDAGRMVSLHFIFEFDLPLAVVVFHDTAVLQDHNIELQESACAIIRNPFDKRNVTFSLIILNRIA